ncbi:hypothetical protein [Pseudonocardia acidicola]|uniref:Uncharacterized protein n=1 Tax=Pseudonocardia acidicola TaxID=2724939 RepID=A0ABX1SD28_9PSEU|nr:hypothetical protein [Pseudonocardia acidicola]NMH98098.1 hypothetical protein [Pseudonocardia acidicola]
MGSDAGVLAPGRTMGVREERFGYGVAGRARTTAVALGPAGWPDGADALFGTAEAPWCGTFF